MDSDFIGETIITVNKPYKIMTEGFPYHGLDNFISNEKIYNLLQEYFYDDSTSKMGYSGHKFAINTLESINESIIERWADYSDAHSHRMENYLLDLANPFNTDTLDDLFHKIPIDRSPIISMPEDSEEPALFYVVDDAKSFRFSDEGKGLFTELAKVELFNHASLRKFANVFGLPTGVNVAKREGLNVLADLADLNEYNTFLFFGAAPVTLIEMELTEYKNVFNLFIAVKTKNAKLARIINARKKYVNEAKNINRHSLNKDSLLEPLKSKYLKTVNETNAGQTFNEKEELMWCRKSLTNILTKKVAFNSKLLDTLDGRFIETKIYRNLFEIAYNQIKDSLINDSEIKRCEYCNHFFEPEHGTQRFCSPLPFRKRSSCENSFNQDRYKKRKQNKEV